MTTRERIGLGAALAGALLLRILLVFSLKGDPFFYVPIVDAAAFDRWANDIATRSFIGDRAFFQDPLYAYGLGIFYKVFGRDLLAARLVQAVIGTLGLWMLFEAVRRFLGYRTAIAALLIGGFTKAFVFYDAMLLKDFLGVVAIEGALLCWSLERPWKWIAFGATLGLGSLVRGNMMLLVAAAAGSLAFRREWRPAAFTVAGALAMIAPVTIRNIAVEKDLVISTSHFGVNLYIGNNPENTTGRYRPPAFLRQAAPEFEESDFKLEAERLNRRPMKPSEVDRYWRGRTVEYIGANPGTFIGVTIKRFLMLVSAFEIPDDHNPYFMERFSWVLRMPLVTFGLFVLPLAAAGIYLSWPDRGRFAMLYVLLGAYALSIVFFFIFGRYRLPMVPILIVFAAHAVVRTAEMIGHRMSQLPKTAAAVFVVAAVMVNIPLPEAVGGHRDFRVAHRNLGVYYRDGDRPLEAAREFEAAAALNPDYLKDDTFVMVLAECYEKGGDAGRALETYVRLAKLNTVAPDVPYRVGMLYLREKSYERAAEFLEETLRRDPKHGAAVEPLAEAYLLLRRPDAARDALDR
ncbi:MAG TPA: glycosyltransferase family 39 protein, partial [Planctomycetota bacterium]|nr:glycosyltransferase family 39 protein [Planctomycetota bacterium]